MSARVWWSPGPAPRPPSASRSRGRCPCRRPGHSPGQSRRPSRHPAERGRPRAPTRCQAAPRGAGPSAHASAGPYAPPWVEASVSDSAMWGSSAGGTGQAPHCPYRHGTARGAAPTSVDADCCPHAVGANGAVASSPRGAWGGTAAHAANRCLPAITLPSCCALNR